MSPITVFFLALFLLAACLIFYTYVLFPAILTWLSERQGPVKPEPGKAVHPVSILMSVFNEEKVIAEKLNSILTGDFPLDKIEIIIGSDCSTDSTDRIVEEFAVKHRNIRFLRYSQRRGKPSVVNDLIANASNEIIILTDANVFFEKETIGRLLVPFNKDEIGLVGANILNVGLRKDGISFQEKSYIQRENLIKFREGKLWGCMMGPFGGCYALRKNLFTQVPAGFLVDDFYISMKVMEKGFKCVNQLDSVCYEDVSNDMRQEYKRKARISAGNYQNLKVFSKFLLRPFTPVGFCFISHKFLRWMTPFLILLSLISLAVLSTYNKIFLTMLLFELIMLTTPLIDFVLGKMSIHLKFLRFASYFSYMNLALIRGFFNYASGIKSGIWQPTKRN
jgi:cellulose synthase/poly-beta-1,6-N-acetylglucosamine synthase-like glycosyltransferase